MTSNKFVDGLKKNIGYVAILIVCIAYLSTSIITISETGKTIYQIIADSLVVFTLGTMITRFFSMQGYIIGDDNEKVIATNSLHSEIVIRISDYLDRLDDWCIMKNKENLKVQRTKILATNGMKYSEYFDEDGDAKGFEFKITHNKKEKELENKRYKAYIKAVTLKLTPLTSSELTTEAVKKDDIYSFGITRNKFDTQSSLRRITTKVVTSLIFGYYGVQLIKDFSYADLVWKGLQIAIFLLMGTIALYQSFFFVTHDERARTIRKIDNLQMFENYIKKENSNGN